MTKFTGFGLVATFGSIGFDCLNSLDVNLSADVYTAACAGQTFKDRVVGASEGSFTINYTMDTTSTTDVVSFLPGTTGTFTCSTSGTYGPTYSAATVIESNNQSYPVEGISTGTAVLGVNGLLTVA